MEGEVKNNCHWQMLSIWTVIGTIGYGLPAGSDRHFVIFMADSMLIINGIILICDWLLARAEGKHAVDTTTNQIPS